MSKGHPQVKNKLNDWYDWLVNHVPKTVKDKVSRAFKTFKIKITGLYNTVTGSGNQSPETQLKDSVGPWAPLCGVTFNGAYRRYRINGRLRMDVETFFHRIRGDLIDLTK